MTLKGKLVRDDMGSGSWVLESKGQRMMLIGDVPAGLDGKDVVVDGDKVDAMGFAMTVGPTIEVRSVKRA